MTKYIGNNKITIINLFLIFILYLSISYVSYASENIEAINIDNKDKEVNKEYPHDNDYAKTQRKMRQQFDSIREIFDDFYAPAQWKKKHHELDLDQEAQKAYDKLDTECLTKDGYKQVLLDFFKSTKDYHVQCVFNSDEMATLHFSVRTVNNKFFIAHIDRDKLSYAAFPFNIGDELVIFDGKPVLEVFNKLKSQISHNVPETDAELASMALTSRDGKLMLDIPKGFVDIAIKRKGHNTYDYRQLAWDNAEYKNHNPHMRGYRDSYLPPLGNIIWQTDNNNPFQAYIYQNTKGKLIGYVRINTYDISSPADYVKNFIEIIRKFEGCTEALVIDQLHNPGGRLNYMYSLISVLTNSPLNTPLHKMTISDQDAYAAKEELKKYSQIKTEEDARKHLGHDIFTKNPYLINSKFFTDINGIPVTLQYVEFYCKYLEFIIKEWETGKNLTSPYYLGGINQINPHPAVNYTKPIAILVDSLDISGGDFFPAIMQDNKRAKIIGTRTAGAGGYIRKFEFSANRLGLDTVRYTASIAERIDKNPIENLGVTPDVELKHTERDFTDNYIDYITAVNNEVNKLIENPVVESNTEDNKKSSSSEVFTSKLTNLLNNVINKKL